MTSMPPPKPVNAPLLPMTRWQGMMIGIGFAPFAAPTARVAFGAANRTRDLSIAACFAVRNPLQRAPHIELELSAARCELKIKLFPIAGKVLGELCEDRCKATGIVRDVIGRGSGRELDAQETFFAGHEQKIADRTRRVGMPHHSDSQSAIAA